MLKNIVNYNKIKNIRRELVNQLEYIQLFLDFPILLIKFQIYIFSDIMLQTMVKFDLKNRINPINSNKFIIRKYVQTLYKKRIKF